MSSPSCTDGLARPEPTRHSHPLSSAVAALVGLVIILTGCSGEFIDVLATVGETYASNPESTSVSDLAETYASQGERYADSAAAIHARTIESLQQAGHEAKAPEEAARRHSNPKPPHPGNQAWGAVPDEEDAPQSHRSRPNLPGLWKMEGKSIQIRFSGEGAWYSGRFYGRIKDGKSFQLDIRNLKATYTGRTWSSYEGEVDCKDIGFGGSKYFRVSHYYGQFRDREKVTIRWGCSLAAEFRGLYRQ